MPQWAAAALHSPATAHLTMVPWCRTHGIRAGPYTSYEPPSTALLLASSTSQRTLLALMTFLPSTRARLYKLLNRRWVRMMCPSAALNPTSYNSTLATRRRTHQPYKNQTNLHLKEANYVEALLSKARQALIICVQTYKQIQQLDKKAWQVWQTFRY